MSTDTQLAPDAAWTKGRPADGTITVEGEPMRFWVPDHVWPVDVLARGHDDSDLTPSGDDFGLVDPDEVAA